MLLPVIIFFLLKLTAIFQIHSEVKWIAEEIRLCCGFSLATLCPFLLPALK